ncbi:hypothetical protein RD792_012299 [Penstemon davidsonii]|uniref:Uncharacterized protein n=1 Tax=Penstemon davidsonii TaxID=160366 RepID=A0ABR0CXC1_9LAMI|nr:hypothetical protein RD792_012299 [Penstemon davidsonii]
MGMILIDNRQRRDPVYYGASPIIAVTEEDGAEILSYIMTNSDPVATILPSLVIWNYEPAPVVAQFSSRGPTFGIPNLLKPDVAAPGVGHSCGMAPQTMHLLLSLEGNRRVYNIISGTSMACPHVSGLAAVIKSQYPTWSPSAIRSAIMTTAIQTNNVHGPITTETGSNATPFLCSIGYDTAMIRVIATAVPSEFSCSGNLDFDSVSSMNYPSIVVSSLRGNEIKRVTRTVTNVGEDESAYTAIVEAPAGVDVEVVPNVLIFTKDVKKLTFQVLITKQISAVEGDLFGSITWSSEKYKVYLKGNFRVTLNILGLRSTDFSDISYGDDVEEGKRTICLRSDLGSEFSGRRADSGYGNDSGYGDDSDTEGKTYLERE